MDATGAILKGVEAKFEGRDKKLDGYGRRLEKIEAERTFIKSYIRDIKTKLSDIPSRKEFNELKTKVDRFHPQI